jgi:hypothetical protein
MRGVIHYADIDEPVMVTFDDQAQHWSQDLEINMLFLRGVENYMNDCLKDRGHVFLNEVYDELGMPRTSKGQLVGWLHTKGNGILFKVEHSEDNAFTLTFNVDGFIYDKLERGIG